MEREYRVRRWTRPECYAGAEWHGYASAGVGQSRESSALERANFTAMLSLLGMTPGDAATPHPTRPLARDESEPPRRQIVRESHWAVGWVEWIAIPLDDREGLRIAARACRDLNAYPVLDEDRWAEMEHDEASEYWEHEDWRTRLEILRDSAADCAGRMREALRAVRGDYGEAMFLLDGGLHDIGVLS